METFFMKLKQAALSIFGKGECAVYQLNLFVWVLFVGLVVDAVISTLVGLSVMYLLGVVMLFTHWFVPYKTIKIFGLTLRIPDYSRTGENTKNTPPQEERRIDLDDVYYIYLSMAIFLGYKILTFILLSTTHG